MESPLDLAVRAPARATTQLATTQLSLGLSPEVTPSRSAPRIPAALVPDLRDLLATLLLEASGVQPAADLGGADAS
jgi:hypothetical protein